MVIKKIGIVLGMRVYFSGLIIFVVKELFALYETLEYYLEWLWKNFSAIGVMVHLSF